MGLVRDTITITNAGDVSAAKRGFIPEKNIRRVTLTVLADTGALTLVIPESVRKELGLFVEKKVPATLANGEKLDCGVTEEVKVRWNDRETGCQAWVVQKDCTVLLGAIPMEGLDITVDPKRQQLVGIHGEEILGILC